MTRSSRQANSSPGRAGFKPRRKPMRLSPPTACACLASLWRAALPAQSPPYGADPKQESSPPLLNSNRPYRRLEINISPTKQRTGVLSNRSKSADSARIGVLRDQRKPKDLSSVFLETHQPAGRPRYERRRQSRSAGRMPAVQKAKARASEGENQRQPAGRQRYMGRTAQQQTDETIGGVASLYIGGIPTTEEIGNEQWDHHDSRSARPSGS
jgi:hypothetical protein